MNHGLDRRGQLVEISGGDAQLTAVAAWIHEQVEPVAWVTGPASCFFPPDLARAGVDLEALVVVRVKDRKSMLRAADLLLRLGGFGMVVVDLNPGKPASRDSIGIPLPDQSRLAGLARKHGATLVFLTRKPAEAASLGPMVGLRVEARGERSGSGWSLSVLRNKQTCAVPEKNRRHRLNETAT